MLDWFFFWCICELFGIVFFLYSIQHIVTVLLTGNFNEIGRCMSKAYHNRCRGETLLWFGAGFCALFSWRRSYSDSHWRRGATVVVNGLAVCGWVLRIQRAAAYVWWFRDRLLGKLLYSASSSIWTRAHWCGLGKRGCM